MPRIKNLTTGRFVGDVKNDDTVDIIIDHSPGRNGTIDRIETGYDRGREFTYEEGMDFLNKHPDHEMQAPHGEWWRGKFT